MGAGAWGTTLARLLCEANHTVTLWGHDADHLQDLARTGVNERYLPGIRLPPGLGFAAELSGTLNGAECVIVAVPSKAFREVTQALVSCEAILVSVTKGIEYESGLTMCGVLKATAPVARENFMTTV